MNMLAKGALVALCLGAASMVGFAVAQTNIPHLFVVSPTGQEIVTVEGTGPQIESVRLSQMRDAAGYTKLAAATTLTNTIPNYTSTWSIVSGSTVTTLNLTMPSAPADGQIVRIWSQPAVTTLNMSANTGQTLNNAITSLSAAAGASYQYSLSNTSWDRID